MKYPKISIITPSYNQGAYIEETILSIINQNYPNLEYIIIDGGSTDNTIEIIKKYEKYLTYWVSEKDNGQSDAINKGLKIATGKIFNWLNSDDYYEPGTLKKVAELFADSCTEVVCGKSTIFGKDYNYTGEYSQGFDINKKIVENARVNQPATFFRMDVVRQLGSLNATLHYCMDLEWWMKYLFTNGKTKIVYTDNILVNFREHSNSKTIESSRKFIEDKFVLYSGIVARKDATIHSIDNYSFDVILSNVPSEFVFQITNQFFLNNAILYYGKRKMSKVKLLLSFVKMEFLDEDKRKQYNRMKFRSNFIPPFFYRTSEK
ncbi:MAG: glycosyltransferase family 2 protein [Bacteroidetes bacterium]|nr:glycosyltransferase family 2 protein [Bacteroidota bacterium]